MKLEKTVQDGTAVILLSGWLDTQTAPELGAALAELEPEVKDLVLDFTELEYISSAGLRQLVAAHKKMNGHLVLKNVPMEIMDVLKMAGFDKRLHIEA